MNRTITEATAALAVAAALLLSASAATAMPTDTYDPGCRPPVKPMLCEK
jgi:hypothetical protein